MAFDARNEYYTEIKVCGIPALLNDARLVRDTVPKGLHHYEVRHADEDGFTPAQIAKSIWVNHYGTLLTEEPLPLGADGYLDIDAETDWDESGAKSQTLQGFMNHQPKKNKDHER